MAEVKAVTDYAEVKTMDKQDAISKGLYEQIGAAIDDKYIEELKKQVIHWDSIKEMGSKLKIVYTPLHGTGNIPARRVLKEIGFENVYVVPEQELPDGDFPTVSYPNPEAAEAFELALKLAKEKDADLVPSSTSSLRSMANWHSYGTMAMSIPALMASLTASFLDEATLSRV